MNTPHGGKLVDKTKSGKHFPSKKYDLKLEVDKDPPNNFHTEAKYLFQPIPFSINIYELPYLFAGKMHAILCRAWAHRIKGRDWYDVVWYVGRKQPLSLKHLERRMQQTGHLDKKESLTQKALQQLLTKKIESVDFDKAKKDVEHLLRDQSSLTLWSGTFFKTLCQKIITQ